MKTRPAAKPINADAYAGFLKLWLTPSSKLPEMTPEVMAYLQHANQAQPLSSGLQLAIGHLPKRAA